MSGTSIVGLHIYVLYFDEKNAEEAHAYSRNAEWTVLYNVINCDYCLEFGSPHNTLHSSPYQYLLRLLLVVIAWPETQP